MVPTPSENEDFDFPSEIAVEKRALFHNTEGIRDPVDINLLSLEENFAFFMVTILKG